MGNTVSLPETITIHEEKRKAKSRTLKGPAFLIFKTLRRLADSSRFQLLQRAYFYAHGSRLCCRFHHFAGGRVTHERSGLAGGHFAQRYFQQAGQDEGAG